MCPGQMDSKYEMKEMDDGSFFDTVNKQVTAKKSTIPKRTSAIAKMSGDTSESIPYDFNRLALEGRPRKNDYLNASLLD